MSRMPLCSFSFSNGRDVNLAPLAAKRRKGSTNERGGGRGRVEKNEAEAGKGGEKRDKLIPC